MTVMQKAARPDHLHTIHSLIKCNFRKCTNLNSFEVRQVLLNLATQLGRSLEDDVVVLHHEGHQFGGKQLIQVHLVYWAQNAVGKHLHHLDTVHKEMDEKQTRNIQSINKSLITELSTVCSLEFHQLYLVASSVYVMKGVFHKVS